MTQRGVVYIVWGSTIRPLLERSIASVKQHHPELPITVLEGDPARGLLNKPALLAQSPYATTLYLDADTVVLGKLDFAFQRAERFGLACCINECPWLRRYGTPPSRNNDLVEYNTGVLCFSSDGRSAIDRWKSWACHVPPKSLWVQGSKECGQEGDDQWAFSLAMLDCNPYVLPLNYNFRPGFHLRFFTPLKVWHSPLPVPDKIVQYSAVTERGERPVTFLEIR